MDGLPNFSNDDISSESDIQQQSLQNTNRVYKKVQKDKEKLLREMMYNSQQNLEKCMKLEEENKNFQERNRDLKESLYSLAEKVDRRDEDLAEVVDKLTELEGELELTKIENLRLRNQLDKKEQIEMERLHHSSFMGREDSEEEDPDGQNGMNLRSQISNHSIRLNKQDISAIGINENIDNANEKIMEKIAEIKGMITHFSENLSDNFQGVTTMVEEQDKEIVSNHSKLTKIDNQIKTLCNELAHYNMTKEEHEMLIKELVNETQENHKALLVMKGMINSSPVMRISTMRGADLGYNNTLSQSELRYQNDNGISKGLSVLEISDFNGMENDEGLGDGILEEIDNVVSEEDLITESCEQEQEEEEEEQEEESESENKDSDLRQTIEERDFVEETKGDRHKEMENKFKNILKPLKGQITSQKSLTQRARLMSNDSQKNEAKDNETIRKSVNLDKSKIFKFIQGSVTRSTIVMEKINQERNKRMQVKPVEKPIYMVKETMSSEFTTGNDKDSQLPEDTIQKLRKEYFKLSVLIKAMQRRIKREDYSIEELWRKAMLDLEVDQYSSYITKHLDKIKEIQRKKKVEDNKSENSEDSIKPMDAEEYSNLAEMIAIKAEIYQNILRHQTQEIKDDVEKKMEKSDINKLGKSCILSSEEEYPAMKHVKWAYTLFFERKIDIYRFLI
ncbi:unnamed protein product [Moneuplotes crassus]|uniref:Uncharacterized protein n=1 Tax=Euplotes crassus TaxID=5936 RepID=A0AAD1Y6C0_EUPCR|nr:unnamed protein product [Moneuplotes crassus]